MHDLVGVAAQQELPRFGQRLEQQRQLYAGQILHLVNHHEVIGRPGQGLPVVGHQVKVKVARGGQPGAVFPEQLKHRRALPGC